MSSSDIAMIYDTHTGEVIRHGPSDEIREWYWSQVRELQQAGADVLPLGCISDPTWSIDDINRLVTHGVRPGSPESLAHHPPTPPSPLEGGSDDDGDLPKGRLEFVAAFERYRSARPGWVVIRVKGFDPDGNPATACGVADPGDFTEGTTYRFMGRWQRHEKYGLQFKFLTFGQDVPHDRVGVIAYLKKTVSGIGEVTAAKIWDAYGPDCVNVLATDPDRVVADGLLRQEVAEDAALHLRQDVFYKARIDLWSIFDHQGIPEAVVNYCIDEWGNAAPDRVRGNPFILLETGIPGCGFARVDALYLSFGHPPQAPVRQAYAAWHAVSGTNSGNTWVSVEAVTAGVTASLKAEAMPRTAVREAMERELLVERVGRADGMERRWLADIRAADAERAVRDNVLRLHRRGQPLWPRPEELTGLTDHQREKYALVQPYPIAILTGTPGSGKTHVLAALVEALVRNHSSLSVGVAAPTGKAAARCTEAIRGRRINVQATTIHSMLGVVPGRRGWNFRYGPESRLPFDIVILDEMSMVNTDLLSLVLEAMPSGANLLMVGDPNQLAPIGHGAPLRDLLRSPVPAVELTEIHRNGGDITQACRKIRLGMPFQFSPRVDTANGHNFIMVECANPTSMAQSLRDFLIAQARRPNPTFHPVNDIQVITMLNRGSPTAKQELNQMIQDVLNPDGKTALGVPFRVGDKVICLSNGLYHAGVPVPVGPGEVPFAPDNADGYAYGVLDNGMAFAHFLVNGDMGRVVAVAPYRHVLRFGDRMVLVRRRMGPVNPDQQEGAFALGYAVTVHKFQGSSAPCVLFMADMTSRAGWLGCRELVYTAFSRGERLTAVFGCRQTVNHWARKKTINLRKTFLREDLTAALRPPLDMGDL